MLTLLGVVVGYLAVEVASRRAVHQPVDQESEAESLVLSALLASPAEVFRVVPALVPEDFTDPTLAEHYRLFTERALTVLSAYEPASDPADRTTAEVDEAVAAARADAASAELVSEFASVVAGLPDLDAKIKDPVIHYGTLVMSAGASRNQNTPRSPLVDVDGTLIRQYVNPSSVRRVLVPLVAGAATLLLGIATSHIIRSNVSLALAEAAVLLVVFISAELSLVDFDTYYLDTPVFWPLTALTWVFIAVAQVIDHHPHRLLAGVVIAGFIAIMFEGLARIFSALRGRTQGAGDTLIVVLTAGAPAALTGSWRVGLYSLIAGCLSAIVEWSYRHFREGATQETPIAFGPHLALGWVIATAVLLALHQL